MEFATIGDTVGVAARICDAWKETDIQKLILSAVLEKLDEEPVTEKVVGFEIRDVLVFWSYIRLFFKCFIEFHMHFHKK